MSDGDNEGPPLRQVELTTARLTDALQSLDDGELLQPSLLPGWTRLTIACHLRYGAQALRRMTDAVVAGQPTSYYPHGRDAQRPTTLEPGPGESPTDVVASLRDESAALHQRWRRVTEWSFSLIEPDSQIDLGDVSLGWLALLRLTEVEVHGTDLGIGLGPWSDLFVQQALPMRLAWLPTRRSNHRPVRHDVHESWLLVPTDGGQPTLLTVEGGAVISTPASRDTPADTIIRATRRELLALLLGRSQRREASRFGEVFPGP